MTDIKYGVSRFTNIDSVTCYMNSILAILQQTPIFVDYLFSDSLKNLLEYKYNIAETENLVTFELFKLLRTSLMIENGTVTPYSLRHRISQKCSIWGEKEQQDSQEFLNFIISTLEEELKDDIKFIPGRKGIIMNNKDVITNLETIYSTISWQKSIIKEYSLIKELFTGMFKTSSQCSVCKNISNKFEIFQILSLSIPIINKKTDIYKKFQLSELLDNYFKPEKLDKNNKITCDFCYIKNRKTQHTILWKPPKILVIQLKRFLVNDYGVMTQKLNNIIEFPISNFNISKYIDPNSPYTGCKYRLYAVNKHHTLAKYNSINFGHYTSIVYNRLNNIWTEYDDNKTIDIINYKDELYDKAYLLFYIRIDNNQVSK